MSARTALTSNDPIAEFDELKREVSVVAQGAAAGDRARPLTDVDWNAAQMILFTLFRRHAQWAARSGACGDDVLKVRGTGATNDFTVDGGGTSLDASPYYTVAGLPAIAPFTAGAFTATADTAKDWLHAKCTAITATKLTDTSKKWKVGALVGRAVYCYTGATISGPTTITANGTHWIQVAGGSNLTTGGHVAGSRYWIAPSTPSGADRTDTVYLDIYADEIAATATTGDPDVDADLNVNVAGTVMETTRRWAIRQSLWYSQGGTSDLALTALSDGDGTYSYVDTDDNTHYVVALAVVNRKDGVATIAIDQVEDYRTYAGRAVKTQIVSALDLMFDGAILAVGDFAPSKNGGAATQLDIAAATSGMIIEGNTVKFTSKTFTAPTGGTAWVSATQYYCFVDARRRIVVKTTLDAGARRICKFITASISDIGVVVDERRHMGGLVDLFKFNSLGTITTPLKMGPTGNHSLRNAADTEIGSLDSLLTTPRLVALGATMPLDVGALGADPSKITFDPTIDDSADADVGGGNTGGLLFTSRGSVRASEASSPKLWKMKKVRATGLRAPGLEFGNSSLAAAPIALDRMVSAVNGAISYGYISAVAQFKNFYMGHDALTFNIDSGIAAFPYGSGAPHFYMPLDIPRGVKITSITARFRNVMTAGEIVVLVSLYYRDAMTGGNPTTLNPVLIVDAPVPRSKTFNSSNPDDQSVVFNSTNDPSIFPLVNPRKLLYLGLQVQAAPTPAAGTQVLYFHGAQIVGEYRAFGPADTGASTFQAPPFDGM